MERYVAIDNVCAWPNLTRLPSGEIIATIFNQPCHGLWEGDVECWASADGVSWELRGVPAPHEEGTNRMNVAAGLGSDGALIVIASGWSDRPPAGQPAPHAQAHCLDPWVCRSTDGGRTWARSADVQTPPDGSPVFVPFGDIVETGEGNLAVSFYGGDHGRSVPSNAWCYFSDDGGSTWERPVTIAADMLTETSLFSLKDAHLLAAARTTGDQHTRIYRSNDAGETWVDEGPATTMHQHPAHLLRLADGRILLVYGIRNTSLHGVGARLSADEGKTWDNPRILVDLDNAHADCGYPASAQLDGGTIVTAYYAASTPAHQRYHMGTVLWEAD